MLPPAGPVAVLRSAYRVPAFCWMLPSWSRPTVGQLGGQIGTLRQVMERLTCGNLHPLEDSERCCRTVRQLSPCCRTVRRLHHCALRNLRRATGVQILDTGQAACYKLSRARVSPHPLLCLYRSARRFYLPPSRIADSDLYPGRRRSPRPGCRSDAPSPPGLRFRFDRPGWPDLAPGWYPSGRPAAAGDRPAAVQYCGRVQLWNNLAAQF